MSKKITAKDISRTLWGHFEGYDYHLENTYVFMWESDFLCASRDRGYFYEVEIKVSRSDFKADFKKDKHELMLRAKEPLITKKTSFNNYGTLNGKRVQLYSGIDYIKPQNQLPNCFYYACPEGIISPNELPPYAGLLVYKNGWITSVKKAPFIHKQNNLVRKRSILLDKFYYLSQRRKQENRHLQDFKVTHEPKLKFLQQALKSHGINPDRGFQPEFLGDYGHNFIDLVNFIYKQTGKDPKEMDIYNLFQKYHGKPPIKEDQPVFIRPGKI